MTEYAQAIQLSDLKFSWSELGPVILELDRFSVSPGQRVFVEGPSGSGKSTLLNLLAGVVIPRTGTVDLLGRRISDMNGPQRDRFRADHIGYIFQLFNLVPYLSVIENVTLPCRFSRRRLERARKISGSPREEAGRLLDHLEMRELMHRPVTELSVGQQQRVAVARALMGSPEILVADEPTSSLDADNREAFLELLFRECEEVGMTVVFVSHDSSLASLFDQRFVIRDARCEMRDKPATRNPQPKTGAKGVAS